MKNRNRIIIAASIVILIAVNVFVLFRIFDLFPSAEPEPKPAPPVEPIAPAVVSVSDTVSDSDTAPVVSEAEVPVVVMTSLDGTDVALRIDEIAQENRCHGLSVAVIKDGQVAYNYEYGYADKKMTREVDSDTKFRIASLSKVYTSMLGMKLVEDGKVDLDGDISDVFGFRITNPYSRNTPITLRMLLTHTSTLRDRSKYIFSGDMRYDFSDRDVFLQRQPGTGFTYSNFGMGVAGALVEKASGLQLTHYSNQVFFDRMEIDAAFNGDLLKDKENVADCILGTSLERDRQKLTSPHGDKEPGQNHTVGAGGLLISAADYARLLTVLMNNGTYNGEVFLSPETVSEILKPQFECKDFQQCIGIRRSENVLEGRNVYYHTGAAYGIFALALYDPADGTGVVVLTTGSLDRNTDIGIRKSCLHTVEAIYDGLLCPVSSSDAGSAETVE